MAPASRPPSGAAVPPDYWLVNTIIGETIDTVQENVVNRYSPVMDPVDRLLGPLDEWCTVSAGIAHWQADVPRYATMMEALTRRHGRSCGRRWKRALAARCLCCEGATARVFGYHCTIAAPESGLGAVSCLGRMPVEPPIPPSRPQAAATPLAK